MSRSHEGYVCRKIFSCGTCEAVALAGSKELLTEWSKYGLFYSAHKNLMWYACGSCTSKLGIDSTGQRPPALERRRAP